MVYDATKSGLNVALWMPSFPLPDTEALTDLLTTESRMSDIDLGKHFLNFPLHANLCPFCGINLRQIRQPDLPKGSKTLWMHWSRCMMGLKSSPYETVQSMHLVFKVANGCRHDPLNALAWESVILNLPGSPSYNPALPWVRRLQKDRSMAGATPVFVDDL
jgi:hypothetical protein